MRLSFLASAMAGGLILGWTAGAQAAPAAPPPAAPIFYCPTPPAAGHAPAAKATPAVRHHHACPTERVAHVTSHHWAGRGHEETRLASRSDDGVSASQAFIYRYERLHHGLDARAADEAWDHGPRGRDHGDHDQWADDGRGGPPPMGPMGPMGHDGHMDGMGPHGPDGDRAEAFRAQHDAALEERRMRERLGEHMDGAPPPLHGPDGDHHYAYLDDQRGHEHMDGHVDGHMDGHVDGAAQGSDHVQHYGYLDEAQGGASVRRYGYVEEHREQSSSGGWVSGGSDHWGHGDLADGRREHGQGWSEESDGSSGWARHDGHAGDGQWRDGSYGDVVEYSGRDAHGYLVWPGKTPPRDIVPDQ